MVISAPSARDVRAAVHRQLSAPTKTLTWGRTSPPSVTRDLARRGPPSPAPRARLRARRGLPPLQVDPLRPSAKGRRGVGREKTTRITAARPARPLAPRARAPRLQGARGRPVGDDRGPHAGDGGQAVDGELPRPAAVAGGVEPAVARPEVDAGRIQAVRGQPVTEHDVVGVPLRQAARQRLPRAAGIARPVDTELALGRDAHHVRLDGPIDVVASWLCAAMATPIDGPRRDVPPRSPASSARRAPVIRANRRPGRLGAGHLCPPAELRYFSA